LQRTRLSTELLAKHLDDKAVEAVLEAKQAETEKAETEKAETERAESEKKDAGRDKSGEAKKSEAKKSVRKRGEAKKSVRWVGRRDKIVSHVDSDARQAADHKKKVKAGYKTHISMDTNSEIVTSVVVTPMNCDDGPVLPVLIEEELQRDLLVEQVAADKAYADGAVRASLTEKSIETYIPEPASKPGAEGKYISCQFHFDSEGKTLTCPAGQLAASGKLKGDYYSFYFSQACCATCPKRGSCLPDSELKAGVRRGRSVCVSKYRPLHDSARAKHETPQHKEAMNERLAVEHKQGEMLNLRGLRHARYRGLMKTTIHAYLVTGVTNIRRTALLCFRRGQNEEMMFATG
jgi:IS5 family transposase